MEILPNRKQQLHEEIAVSLRESLRLRTVGDRLPNDAEHARMLGVSVVTIRDAMRLLEAEGLVVRRRGSGTYVERQPTISLGRVAVICSEEQHLSTTSNYWRLVVQGVHRQLKQADYLPELHLTMDGELDPTAILRETPTMPLAGIIVVNAPSNCAGIEALAAAGKPIVGGKLNHETGFRADNDVPGMVRAAVRYLLDHGRRRLALVTTAKANSLHPGVDDWMEESFLAAMAQAGVPFVPEWVSAVTREAGPGAAFDTMLRLWNARDEHPDGLIVTDDSIYSEVAMGLLELDVDIPRDLMVVTHANLGAEMFYPFPTTRFAFDAESMAEVLVRKFGETLAGTLKPPYFSILPFQLIEPSEAPKAPRPHLPI